MNKRVKVEMLTMTPNAEALVYTAAKTCTSKEDSCTIFADISAAFQMFGPEAKPLAVKTLKEVLESGHMSVVEHCCITFSASNVDRNLSHQLVRHRLSSYSHRSQRYVDEQSFEYIIPKTIIDKGFETKYRMLMNSIDQFYKEMTAGEVPKEDARFVLPNAATSSIMITMNFRSLLHFFSERTCHRAQWGIRDLANQMFFICKEVAPLIFTNAGPKCAALGYCPEKRSCGKMITKNELFRRASLYKDTTNKHEDDHEFGDE